MAIAFAEVQSGNQAATGTSVASASLGAGGSDSVYIALISTRSNANVSALSGLGLTWNELKEQCAARAQTRIEAWYAYGAGSSGAVTATHASSAVSLISVLRLTGVEVSEPVEQALGWNSLGLSGACTGGTDNNDAGPWTDLTTVHANSWVIYAVNSRTGTASTWPTTGDWTSRVTNYTAGSGGNVTTHSVETRLFASASTVVTNGAANNLSGAVDHCEIAIEIRETASGGGVLVPQIVANYRRNRAA